MAPGSEDRGSTAPAPPDAMKSLLDGMLLVSDGMLLVGQPLGFADQGGAPARRSEVGRDVRVPEVDASDRCPPVATQRSPCRGPVRNR
jgi:hypothetical protein